MSVLKNVVISWANIQTPNTQFQPTWEIQAHLSEEQANELMAEAKKIGPKGIKIKKDDNGELTYRFKRRVERADGAGDNDKPVVYGPKGKTGGDFTELVGNGSVCNIQYLFLPYDNKFGKGVTCDLKGVQVMHHIPFGIQDGDEFDSEEDEPVSASTKKTTFNDEYDDDEDFN